MSGSGWIAGGLLLAIVWPLMVAMLQVLLAWRRGVARRPGLGPLWLSAPLPALLVVMLLPDGSLELSWWLLGGVWELDAWRRSLLGLTALLWGLAGGYARGYLAPLFARAHARQHEAGRRLLGLTVLWPLTLTGNLLLILAEDIASFYTGFTLMTFAAYGLVVHEGTREARHGGLAYLVMAVFGEGLILGGLLWAAGAAETLTLSGMRQGIAESPQASSMSAILWLGFGVKAGVVLLHVWLPLAHPVAPTPASAVLSGAMIKAGLVGWWQTLPLGMLSLSMLGWGVVMLGMAGAFAAALYGITQRRPKAILAYSSISQMGMLTALVGAGMVTPASWATLTPAIALFAVHHGLNKGALFLGVGITEHPPRWPAWLLWGLLMLPALSLTGALASGLPAKWGVKTALYAHDWKYLVMALSVAAVGTTLLVARALWRQGIDWRRARHEQAGSAPTSMLLAWVGCIGLAATVPWWLPLPEGLPGMPPLKEMKSFLWPPGVGILLALSVVWLTHRPVWQQRVEFLEALPAGDLWHGYSWLARWAGRHGRQGVILLARGSDRFSRSLSLRFRYGGESLLSRLERAEGGLHSWAVLLMLLAVLVMGGVLAI